MIKTICVIAYFVIAIFIAVMLRIQDLKDPAPYERLYVFVIDGLVWPVAIIVFIIFKIADYIDNRRS